MGIEMAKQGRDLINGGSGGWVLVMVVVIGLRLHRNRERRVWNFFYFSVL
ncbi:hypothetical protein HanPSC8_Chr03g0094171 [Helianthus annuus]|nr:hypothetical protein HanPSC8_Chr03g0094171 [Helianthus annuus]